MQKNSLCRTNHIAEMTAIALIFFSKLPAHATTFIYDQDNKKVFISGYAALDMISDTTQGIDEIVGSTAVSRPGSVPGDTGRTIFSSRTSRLGMGLLNQHENIKVKAMVEADFLGYEPPVGNGVSESAFYQNPTLRLRHAYFTAESQGWTVLAGQYWTLCGWQAEYIPRTVSLPPMTGTVFARTPQLTGMKTIGSPEKESLTLAISSSRSVQRDGQSPNLDAGIKLSLGYLKAPFTLAGGDTKLYSASIAVTGTRRQLAHPSRSNGKIISLHKSVNAFVVDALLPIIPANSEHDMSHALVLTGEYSTGEGFGDLFPRWTGNIANPSGSIASTNDSIQQPYVDAGVEGYKISDNSLDPVEIKAFNTNIQYHLPQQWKTWMSLGTGELSSKNAKNLKPNGTLVVYDRQRGAYLNLLHDFSPEIRAGLEYAWMQTRYIDQIVAQNNRVQLTTWFRF